MPSEHSRNLDDAVSIYNFMGTGRKSPNLDTA